MVAYLGKNISESVRSRIIVLEKGLSNLGFQVNDKGRGHFGMVRRFSRSDAIWFDVLPAKDWFTFYLSSAAARFPGLTFRDMDAVLTNVEERKDLVVKVRIDTDDGVSGLLSLLAKTVGPSG